MSPSRAPQPARVIDTTGEDITDRAQRSRDETRLRERQPLRSTPNPRLVPFASTLRRVPLATFWPDPRGDARA